MEGVREEEGKGRDRKGWEGRGCGEEGKGREGLAGDEGDGWLVTGQVGVEMVVGLVGKKLVVGEGEVGRRRRKRGGVL